MQKVVTHSGGFHADEVFAVATLSLALGRENIEVARTRDEDEVAAADIAVDVGGQYDPARRRFDHHQVGAPVRESGIPYAAFGLVWKEYGEQVAGGREAAARIEERLVLPIDAADNGLETFAPKRPDLFPATIQDLVGLMKPAWQGTEEMDARFEEAVALARLILERAVMHAKAETAEAAAARALYDAADDKRVLVSEVALSPGLFIDQPSVLFIVFPDEENDQWKAAAIRESREAFALRARFPEAWGGLRLADLAAASGIPDAVFCHRAGFLFVAKSREGTLAAVRKSLVLK